VEIKDRRTSGRAGGEEERRGGGERMEQEEDADGEDVWHNLHQDSIWTGL